MSDRQAQARPATNHHHPDEDAAGREVAGKLQNAPVSLSLWKISLMDSDGNVRTRRKRDRRSVRNLMLDLRNNASMRAAMITGPDGGMGFWRLVNGKWKIIVKVIAGC
jgi:hypothetical protein